MAKNTCTETCKIVIIKETLIRLRMKPWLLFPLFFSIASNVFCQSNEDVTEDEEDDIKAYIDERKIRKEKLQLGKNAPPVDIALEPREGDAIAYFPQVSDKPNATAAQVSIGFTIFNNGTKKITLEKVVYKYNDNGKGITKTFETGGEKGVNVKPGQSGYWQNKRGYHEPGDVLFFDGQVPSSITAELYFADYAKPVIISKPLVKYTPAFRLPFKAEDLEEGEYWTGAASHGGKQQVFAYDLSVVGGKNGRLQGKKEPDGPQTNENVRVYGKRIYAMADGEIVAVRNDQPDNSRPGVKDSGKPNEVVIRHGDFIMKYEHFIKGSISASLRVGTKVKAGDFLGQAGNSGNASGPHLHICVYRVDGTSSPLLFSNGFVLNRQSFSKTTNSSDWIPLKGRGLPTEKSLIWPGSMQN
jgi:murein DD-endopeptidase MepM/ murein hydrolase activator NlpD